MKDFSLDQFPIDPWLSERHHQVVHDSAVFARQWLAPAMEDVRKTGKLPPDVLTALRRSGWFGLLIPAEYGGGGLDSLARILNVQHIARACPAAGAVVQIAQLGTGGIIEFGSPEQKEKWLPLLANGDRICTISITEENSGSHVLGLKARYRKRGDHYIINGEKSYIGNCPIANMHVVYARSEDNPKEISAFIVEGERDGVDNSDAHATMGLGAFPMGKLKLTDCAVPVENRLGEEGQGLAIAYKVISCHGRPSLTALALGIHHRVLDITIQYANERQLYGKPIKDIPDVRQKIFDIYNNYESCRLSAYYSAYLYSNGGDAFKAVALAKYMNGEYACRSALIASEIFGARAGVADYEIAQLLLDAMMTRPPSGTGDVQRRRVLEDLLEGKKQY